MVGPVSEDERWMINPKDIDDQSGEILPVPLTNNTERFDISSPQLPNAGPAHTYDPISSSIQDIDVSLMVELGEAITRGATDAAAQALLPPSTAASPGSFQVLPKLQSTCRKFSTTMAPSTWSTRWRKRFYYWWRKTILCSRVPRISAQRQQ